MYKKLNTKYIGIFIFFALFIFSFSDILCNAEEMPTGISTWEDELYTGAESTYVYPAPGEDSTTEVIKYIGYILNWVVFLGAMLIIRIVWAGYIWMTAGGNTEKVEESKKTIRHAVIGIVIIIALYVIGYFVVDRLEFISGYKG